MAVHNAGHGQIIPSGIAISAKRTLRLRYQAFLKKCRHGMVSSASAMVDAASTSRRGRMDSFHIDGPAYVSFSGGRTSGYMLWRILRAWDGKLPQDVHVLFANTGDEMQATLDFVHACSERWDVPITWVEYFLTPQDRAAPHTPFAAHTELRPYMRRVPKERLGEPVDRQFWLGEVLDDIRQDAERELTRAELNKYEEHVERLLYG
jgi:hypothetical protein